MKIKIDHKEIIPLDNFELKWRWAKTHNPDISASELSQILPLSEVESRRINKVISYFENEENIRNNYEQTGWISASSESEETIERFRKQLITILEALSEDIIVTWDRQTTLKTTKKIFIKYWNDFCYPSSDDVTIISEDANWIMIFNHIEVANIWLKVT